MLRFLRQVALFARARIGVTPDQPGLRGLGSDAAHEPTEGRRYCLVGSSGGHLLQLVALRDLWARGDRFWVCFDKEDARSILQDERCYWGAYPTNRNLPNLVRNFGLAWLIFRRERPTVVLSTGAGIAIPFFLLGRLFGATLVYIEVYDRVTSPTVTGRFCHMFAHVFALQWPEQQRFYRKGQIIGPLL
jgi:beta-1,4-N-acetylglucosaminyltransferase